MVVQPELRLLPFSLLLFAPFFVAMDARVMTDRNRDLIMLILIWPLFGGNVCFRGFTGEEDGEPISIQGE